MDGVGIVVERPRQPTEAWLTLRRALWPHHDEAEHRREMTFWCADRDERLALLVLDASGAALGFAEAALRRDHVNGTDSSPVGFLEGIYVAPAARRASMARMLVEAVADWVRARGCSELASDANLENVDSHAMHRALGFEETERVVYFRRGL